MAVTEEAVSENFDGRIALVTGASRGLGRAVALELARRGAHLLALARTRGALAELDDEIKAFGGQCSLIQINLLETEKLDALGPSLYQRFQHLDILVSCAAVLGPLSPLNHISGKEWTETFDINLHANWRLIRTLDPLLRAAPAARGVFFTSGAAERCRGYWGPYSASKAALNALVKTFANELANTAVRVNLFDPGPVATFMRSRAYPGEDPAKLVKPHEVAPSVLPLLSPLLSANGEIFRFEGVKSESEVQPASSITSPS
jgi:NAD(P)-dependent dehydrogenase (short-subunit alcohol dehydrogenase family)